MFTQCPHCKQVYEVPDDVPLKTELQCPSCQNNFLLNPYSEGGRNTSTVQNRTIQNSNNSVSAQAREDHFFNNFETVYPLGCTRALIIFAILGVFIGFIGALGGTIAIHFIPYKTKAYTAVCNWVPILFSIAGSSILLIGIGSILSGVVRAVLETRDNTKAIRELLARNLENK